MGLLCLAGGNSQAMDYYWDDPFVGTGPILMPWDTIRGYWQTTSGSTASFPSVGDNATILDTDYAQPIIRGTTITINEFNILAIHSNGTNTFQIAQLTISNNGKFITTGTLAQITSTEDYAEGFLSVSGSSVWENAGDVVIGAKSDGWEYDGFGSMSLYSVSTVTNQNATIGDTGYVTVSGSSSWQSSGSFSNYGWLYVSDHSVIGSNGLLSYGPIYLEDSSVWNNTGDFANFYTVYLTQNSVFNNTGTLTLASSSGITIQNSILTNADAIVNGNINLDNGQWRSRGAVNIATDDSSFATISGNNESTISTGNLAVGNGANANAAISLNHSVLTSQNAVIADGVGSNVSVDVGLGSKWNTSGSIAFATNGTATLRIDNGSEVYVGQTLELAANANASANLSIGESGRLNVSELALGVGTINSGSGLNLTGNNNIGKITGGKKINVTISGTTTFNGKSEYTGTTTIAYRAAVVLNNKDSQLGTGNLTNAGVIHFAHGGGLGTLTVDGTYTGDDGVIYLTADLSNATTDQLVINGDAKGHTTLFLNNVGKKGGPTTGNGIQVVDVAGTSDAGAFTANDGRPIYAGLYKYTFNQTGNDWYLTGVKNMAAGNAILNTAGATSITWFTQLDNLGKRLGEVRQQAKQTLSDYILYGKKGGDAGVDFWARSYGRQANVKLGIEGIGSFRDYLYGIDVGGDKIWTVNDHNSMLTGYFIGYSGAQRDFKSNGSDGKTTSYYTGVYGTWINEAGWYADLVAKGQYFDNSYDIYGDDYFTDHGKYSNWAAGVSLEIGKQFRFNNGLFLEPSIQAAYTRVFNSDYESDVTTVEATNADILRLWGGVRVGWNIKVHEKGNILQPYLKGGVQEQISSGGKVQIGGDPMDVWRPNSDGLYYLGGAGLMFQISEVDQLHLDYEATFGHKYDVPWNINLGYRHQF